MSLLKRLFGGHSPAERLAKAERLIAEGQLGLGRLELERALALAALPPDDRARAERLRIETGDTLARERLAEAQALLESGDADTAVDLLEIARPLASDLALAREIERLLAPRHDADLIAGAGDSGAADEPDSADGDEEEDEPEAELAPEGDDELSTLEIALLAFPEEEVSRLQALVAVEPALGEALALAYAGNAAEAVLRFRLLRQPATSDPIVRRERARAALQSGDTLAARSELEEMHQRGAADAETLELLMEARVATGDTKAAADTARALLARGLPRSLEAMLSVLLAAGDGEEAIRQVDVAIDREKNSARLWELRGALCSRLGSVDGQVEADRRAIELYRAECASCGPKAPRFPLGSARRLASALAAGAGRRRDDELVDLLRHLLAHDPEGRRRWSALLADLGG